MSTSPPKIYGAIAKVMAEVGAVGKNGRNEHQRYKFRGVDDVVAALQQVMAAHGVVVVPRVVKCERKEMPTKNGGLSTLTLLEVDHHFFAEDGSSVISTTIGEALDTSDKSANKAMSAALKYALTETFSIPTYEIDRDTEEHHHEPVQQQDQRPAGPPPSQQRQAPPKTQAADPVAQLRGATRDELEVEIAAAADMDRVKVLAQVIGKDHPLRAKLNDRYNALAPKAPPKNDSAPVDGKPAAGWERGTQPDSKAGEKPRGAVTRTNGHVSQGAAKAGEIREVGEEG